MKKHAILTSGGNNMKQIKQWMRNYNKQYKKADVWSEALHQREEKKLVHQQQVVEAQVVAQVPIVDTWNSRTIFSRDNLGHNGEELQKIKQIYTELENVFSPKALAV